MHCAADAPGPVLATSVSDSDADELSISMFPRAAHPYPSQPFPRATIDGSTRWATVPALLLTMCTSNGLLHPKLTIQAVDPSALKLKYLDRRQHARVLWKMGDGSWKRPWTVTLPMRDFQVHGRVSG